MGNKGYQVQPNMLFWIRIKTLQDNNQIHQILQIAYMYTDTKLSICQAGSHIAVRCDKERLDQVDDRELKYFQLYQRLLKESGLYEACLDSKVGMEEVEELIMKDIELRKIARGQLIAAGKQVHLTKYALMRLMPRLHDFLHYRIFDLDSVKMMVERFKYMQPQQGLSQQGRVGGLEKRAREGVYEDIHEMQFYYQHALNDN